MTTPKEALELKPCPFCSGSATIERYGNASYSTIYTCDECGCRLETGEEFNHGSRWNTRATASFEGDAVERVARIVDPSARRDKGYKHAEWRIQQSLIKARAILATGLVPDEAAVRADSTANLISIIADIREKTGVGGKPMLNELADAIVAEIDRRVAGEREKCAKVADGIMYPDFEKSSDIEKQAYNIRCSIAAAIRSGGVSDV